jgi:hypothetical protein
VRDVVGPYLDPPDRALVLSVDEKPQIQATTGTAPVLPTRPGQPSAAERRRAPPSAAERRRAPPSAARTTTSGTARATSSPRRA